MLRKTVCATELRMFERTNQATTTKMNWNKMKKKIGFTAIWRKKTVDPDTWYRNVTIRVCMCTAEQLTQWQKKQQDKKNSEQITSIRSFSDDNFNWLFFRSFKPRAGNFFCERVNERTLNEKKSLLSNRTKEIRVKSSWVWVIWFWWSRSNCVSVLYWTIAAATNWLVR